MALGAAYKEPQSEDDDVDNYCKDNGSLDSQSSLVFDLLTERDPDSEAAFKRWMEMTFCGMTEKFLQLRAREKH